MRRPQVGYAAMTSTDRVRTAVLMFTRDLRLHDNPALHLACRTAEQVIPIFVLDPALVPMAPHRHRFLHESLADLRESLRARGADLVVRTGDPVTEVIRLAREQHAELIVLADDVSRYAKRRHQRLDAACRQDRRTLRTVDSVTVVPPGALVPTGGDHYKVFTPYWKAWSARRWRDEVAPPRQLRLPAGLDTGALPDPTGAVASRPNAALPAGGERPARRRMHRWLADGLVAYGERHDDLAGDATSRLSAALHFGCLSPLELASKAGQLAGGEPYVRQLCWRDFHAQVVSAFPDLPTRDYRPRRDVRWREDPDALAAWQEGQTGYPIIDAGMRQLATEGFMHNRARLLVAAFLTRQLDLHWSVGAAHFFDLLVDGDIANNAGNWQWVAGTGNDTRPNRQFNPLRQAHRFDPNGDYVRRYVPELVGVPGGAVHEPWQLRLGSRYPPPLISPPGTSTAGR